MKKEFSELLETTTKYNEYFSDCGWCVYDKLKPEIAKNAVRTYEEKGLAEAEAL
jgi:hypothetical protein